MPLVERRQLQRRARSGRRQSDWYGQFPPHVLVIDPHEDTRLLYAMVLGEADCLVYGAPDGRSGLAAAEHRLPDAVVTELAVPEFDGFEILQRLGANPVTRHIPVVAATGLLHDDIPERAQQAGFAAVLEKPLEPAALLQKVRDAVLATPPDRRVRRQLRRTLFTLQKLGSHLARDRSVRERVAALIDRLQIAVLAFDERGRYVAVSPAVSSLTGYSRTEILSRSIFEAPVFTPVPNVERRWRDFLASQYCTTTSTLRDARGGRLELQAAFMTLLPGMHAAAIAPHPGDHADGAE
jgi:PAS domain S-box-containing protein